MGWKRILGLALASVALALVVWGLVFFPMTVSIKVDLPPAAPPAKPKTIDVYIAPSGAIRVGDSSSSLDTLPGDLATQAGAADKARQHVLLHAGHDVTYGVFSPVLERVRNAGWSNVGWVKDEAP